MSSTNNTQLYKVVFTPSAMDDAKRLFMSQEMRQHLVKLCQSLQDWGIKSQISHLEILKPLADVGDVKTYLLRDKFQDKETSIVFAVDEKDRRIIVGGLYDSFGVLSPAAREQMIHESEAGNKINPNEPREMYYWATKFHVTPSQLVEAIKKVGPNVAAVELELTGSPPERHRWE